MCAVQVDFDNLVAQSLAEQRRVEQQGQQQRAAAGRRLAALRACFTGVWVVVVLSAGALPAAAGGPVWCFCRRRGGSAEHTHTNGQLL